jgi:hypothetical protein
MSFRTNNTERMRIDSSGKVRIGATLGLNHLLNIQTASTSGLAQIEFRNTQAGSQIGMPANTNALSFFTADNERMRIDNKGSVGVGVTPNTGWNSNATSGRVPIQVGFGSISGRLNDLHTEFTNNAYASGAGNDPQWAGITRWAKSQIEHDSGGQIIFKTSPVVSEAAHNSNPNITWTEQVVITNNGSVGVGPVAPQTKLHVESSDGSGIRVSRTGATAYMQLFPAYSNVPTIMGLGASGLHLGYNSATAGIRIATNNNVGIGTNTPHKLLQVKESSTSVGVYYPLSVGGSSHVAGYAAGIGLDPEGYGNRNKIAIVAEGRNNGYSRGKLHFLLDKIDDSNEATLADSKMVITEDGEVGIGTSSPSSSYKLSVHGHTQVGDGGGAVAFNFNATSNAQIKVNGSEKMRIDSSGRVKIGTTSTVHDAKFNLAGTGGAGAQVYMQHNETYVVGQLQGGAGVSTKTATLVFESNHLRAQTIEMETSGHKYNNGADFWHTRHFYTCMSEGASTRLNSRISNHEFEEGGTNRMTTSLTKTSGSNVWTAVITIQGEYQGNFHFRMKGYGAAACPTSLTIA